MRSPPARLLVLGGALALLGCRREPTSSPGPPACPAGQQQDSARARRITSLLATTPAGRDLLGRARRGWRLCFATDDDSTATEDGRLTLSAEGSDAECAARLAHLLLHLVEGDVVADGLRRSQPCSAVVREAVLAEARAHALELELRRRLGVVKARRQFPFETEFWRAEPGQRVALLAAYFHAHPRGGGGAPGLVDAFSQRCAARSRGR